MWLLCEGLRVYVRGALIAALGGPGLGIDKLAGTVLVQGEMTESADHRGGSS